MSAYYFIGSLMSVRNALFPLMTGAETDPARRLALLRRTWPLWYSPAIVVGGNPDEMPFLSAVDRAALGHLIPAFRSAVEPPADPPSDAQLLAAFDRLSAILHPFEGTLADPVRDEVTAGLWRAAAAGRFPAYGVAFDCSTDLDWSGDPAVRVRVFITDEAEEQIETEEFDAFQENVRQVVWDTLVRVKSDRWPYISVRTLSGAARRLAGAVP